MEARKKMMVIMMMERSRFCDELASAFPATVRVLNWWLVCVCVCGTLAKETQLDQFETRMN